MWLVLILFFRKSIGSAYVIRKRLNHTPDVVQWAKPMPVPDDRITRDLDYNIVEQKGYHAESYTTEGGIPFGSFLKANAMHRSSLRRI